MLRISLNNEMELRGAGARETIIEEHDIGTGIHLNHIVAETDGEPVPVSIEKRDLNHSGPISPAGYTSPAPYLWWYRIFIMWWLCSWGLWGIGVEDQRHPRGRLCMPCSQQQ